MKRLSRLLTLTVLGLGMLSAIDTAAAADYPDKPITLVVPFTPGGTTDILARLTAEALGRRLGQTVVVENRGGAAGNIGTTAFTKAAPDGYTLLMANRATNTINPSLYKNLDWDPIKDFTPLAMIVRVANIIVVTPGLNVNSLQELVAYARKNPNTMHYGSIGVGGISHFAGLLFNQAAQIQMTPVAYRGTNPALTDAASGHIQLMFPTIPGALPFIQGGRLKPLAVTGSSRAALFPDLPTAAQAGYPELSTIENWFAVFAPGGIPEAVRTKLVQTLDDMLHDPDFQQKLQAQGAEPGTLVGKALEEKVIADVAYWKKVILDTGMTVDGQ